MRTTQRSINLKIKNIRLQYFYGPDVQQVSNRAHIVDLCNDIMIGRDPLVFSAALLRKQKCPERLPKANKQPQCS
ncbi:hypothetical protein BDR03DRAFT_971126 [Suillus americanus]|nr:hypothetical protein BDR03DRAFT_971126 [Suillus americanus]